MDCNTEKDTMDENAVNSEIQKTSFDDDKQYTVDEDVITPSMMEEQKKLQNEEDSDYEEQDEEEQEKGAKEISPEERFKRLTLLLQKSKVYADFLLKILEKRKRKEQKRALKKEKKQKVVVNKSSIEKGNSTEISSSQTSKRKSSRTHSNDGGFRKRPKKESNEVSMKSQLEGEEYLQKSLYFPTKEDVVNMITEVDGVRYFGDQVVNPVQPVLFTGGVLRDYQITGYQWLKLIFENAVNGILADEMGLGKTIQSIALICRLIKVGFRGPFLICAPMSTIPNWLNEFKTFAPSVPLLLYHGSAKERLELAKYINSVGKLVQCHPVVITSYEILMRDRPVLSTHLWEYLIVDEGHRIKNHKCKLFRELKMLRVNARLLLTGTPLQNNLSELWSLLNFIIPEVFDDLQVFQSWFSFGDGKTRGATEFSYEQEETFLSTLYEILTPFVLRRAKADVSLEIPPKSEMIVYAPLSDKQETFYRSAVDRTIRKIVGTDKRNELVIPFQDKTNFSPTTRSQTADVRLENIRKENNKREDEFEVNVSLTNIMMLLRKCCNHPYLIEYPLIPGTNYFRTDEEVVTSSGKLMLLDRLLTELKKRGHKVLLFSQMTRMLDILQDYCHLRELKYVRLDGSTAVYDRQIRIKEFNSDPELFIFLLSTKAGGLGINLTAADTVIIFDSDWNPQNDLQAQDRCHRIGQTRPVMVYRLVTRSSVDEEMVKVASQKRKLEKMVMHSEKFKGNLESELKQQTRIGRSEIMKMLQSSCFESVADSSGGVITDEELERILDRSSLTSQSK